MRGSMPAWGAVLCVIQTFVRQLVEDSIIKFDGLRHDLDCLVIMPNHVHLILKPRAEENVFQLIGGMKGGSARFCNARLGRTHQAF